MLFVCEQYGQWRAVTGWCYPVERVVLGGDTGQNDGDVPVSAEQYELRTRVQGEWCDGLLPVSRGEGRVQHGVGGEGYSGELTRQCSFFGDWIKVCGLCTGSRCPAEEQSAVMWAATDSMETASWVSGLGAGFACVWGADGVWRDDDRRGGVPCVRCGYGVPSGVSYGLHGLVRASVQRQDREELRAHHVSGGVVRGRDVARDEGRLDGGALVRRGRGGRFEARVQRERRVVVRGVGRGLLLPADGGGSMFDDVCVHYSVHVLAGRFVDGPGERVRAHHVPRRDDGGFVLPDDGERHDACATRRARGARRWRASARARRRWCTTATATCI